MGRLGVPRMGSLLHSEVLILSVRSRLSPFEKQLMEKPLGDSLSHAPFFNTPTEKRCDGVQSSTGHTDTKKFRVQTLIIGGPVTKEEARKTGNQHLANLGAAK